MLQSHAKVQEKGIRSSFLCVCVFVGRTRSTYHISQAPEDRIGYRKFSYATCLRRFMRIRERERTTRDHEQQTPKESVSSSRSITVYGHIIQGCFFTALELTLLLSFISYHFSMGTGTRQIYDRFTLLCLFS